MKPNWLILANAMMHLCDRVMESGDVQAWWLMSDIKDVLMAEPSPYCIATVAQGTWDPNGFQCRKPAVGVTQMCATHLETI